MDTKDIIGLIIGLSILGNSAFNSWQNDRLKDKVERLETLSVYSKAIMDGNTTKQEVYRKLTDKIEKEFTDEVKTLNDTAIGDTIEF